MKTPQEYEVIVYAKVKEAVIVQANSEEEAIEKYYDGDYTFDQELDRDIEDTYAQKIEVGGR